MFSDSEKKLIKLINKKPITIAELTSKYYGDDQPFEASKRIAGLVNRITAKLKDSDVDWDLESQGGGRGGKSVWKVKR